MTKNDNVVLNNAKNKFNSVRNICTEMDEDVYALTDYISLIVNHQITPTALAMVVTLIIEDLNSNKNGFDSERPFSDYLKENKEQIISKISCLPEVVDSITSEDEKQFAEDFRKICNEVFQFESPKHVNADLDNSYPTYVQEAVDWWANAIQSPNTINTTNPYSELVALTGRKIDYSKQDIKTFKTILAKEILNEIRNSDECGLYVNYEPCKSLLKAGKTIGLNTITDYPYKTGMIVSRDSVIVFKNDNQTTIWSFEEKTSNKQY